MLTETEDQRHRSLDSMDLICDFGGAGMFCDKGLNFQQLALIPIFKPQRVMKNEL